MALAVASLLIAAITTGMTLAATGLLLGSPAPAEVVEDFKSYTPQLGYHPQSRRAQLVAEDGDFRLFATTNREGTYCIVTSAPWRHPGKLTGDGGVCASAKSVREPIAVAITAASAVGESGQGTVVVVGRVRDQHARTIHFTDASGQPIERMLGAAGFFVVGVQYACTGESWSPTFKAMDAAGDDIATARITLMYVDPRHAEGDRCGGFEGTPHGPYLFDG